MKPAGCGRIPPQRLKAATYDRQAPQAPPPQIGDSCPIIANHQGSHLLHRLRSTLKYPTTYEKLLLHIIVAICLVAWMVCDCERSHSWRTNHDCLCKSNGPRRCTRTVKRCASTKPNLHLHLHLHLYLHFRRLHAYQTCRRQETLDFFIRWLHFCCTIVLQETGVSCSRLRIVLRGLDFRVQGRARPGFLILNGGCLGLQPACIMGVSASWLRIDFALACLNSESIQSPLVLRFIQLFQCTLFDCRSILV